MPSFWSTGSKRRQTTEIAKQFGDKFVAKLADVPIGQWFGPVESGYGMHLVFVEERTEGVCLS